MKKLYSIINFLFVILIAAAALNAQTVSVDKQSLTFSAQTGGSAQSQQLTINNAGSTSFAVFSNAPWLKINGQLSAAGQTPATVTITADPTNMFAGTYSGALSVQGISGPAVNVPVTFTISSIGVSPSPVTFTYQSNGLVPNPVVLTLTSAVNTNFSATATTASGGNWLVVPASGVSPGTLAVSLNSAVVGPGMAPGTYNGTVTITPFTGAPAVAIPVVLTVAAAPTVTASPTSINLNYQSNGASASTNTPAQTLTLTNPGSTDLTYLISPASTPGGWLTVNTNGTTIIPANGSVQVTVSYLTASNLPPGTYTGSLTIFIPNAANQQITVPVHLLIANTPLINIQSGASLAFTSQISGPQPAPKPVLVTSTAASADAATGQLQLFITETTASGGNWLTVPVTSLQTGMPFNVSVNAAGLAVGTYNGTVTVTGIGAANSPQTIPVTLTVSNDPLVVVSFGGCSSSFTTCPLNFPIQIGQNNPTTQNVRVTSSTGTPASFTAAASMTPSAACGTAWLSTGVTTAVVSNDVTFPITVIPGSIVSGTTCTGTVTITGINPTTGAALPNSPVTIPVTMYVNSASMLVANPVALNFTTAANSSASQNLVVTSTSAEQLVFGASTSANAPWLLAGPASRTTAAGSNIVIVAVNSSGLAPGTYSSAVTISAPGVFDSPITVPVTLTVTGATLSVTPTSLALTQTLGAAAATGKVTVSTSGSDVTFNTSVSMTDGSGWLTATPASATATSATPATVTVTANGSNLAAGTYHGTVTITSTSGFTSGSPATVAVTLEVKPGTIAVTPASLSFAQAQNSAAPASQTITVTGTPGPLAFTVTTSTNANSGNWITVTPTSGNTPTDLKVTVNGASLAPGDYSGKVTITSTGATGSPMDIPVSLKVSTSATLAVSQGTVNLSYVIGTPTTPLTQTVQLTASGPGVTFSTAATVTSGGNWLTVTPASGTAPATLTITATPSGLAAGDYTGTIAINSPNSATQPAASISVKLSVLAVPKPVAAAVQNAASALIGAVSPGENIVIYGSGLGPATLAPYHITNGVFDTTVANTRVLFDGVAAPIIYARADQTSVMVPYFVARGPSTSMVIEYLGVQSNPTTLSVTNTMPGIYTLNQAGSGQGAILNQDLSGNAAANPAAKNTAVAIYMTGEGTTSPTGVDGGIAALNGSPLAKPILPVTATVGGVAANVEYYGSAPSLIYGVMQVNVRIPANAPSGPNVPIVIRVGTTPSQANVTVAIQ